MRTGMLALGLALSTAAYAQQRSSFVVNAETPEGKELQAIGQESDPAKKIALADKFLADHPTHEGLAWLSGQMEPVYVQAGQFDKALAAAGRVYAADPDDVESAYQGLKAAEGKKDPKLVIEWSGKTSAAARKVAASPQPSDAAEVENWKKRVDYATQVDTYTEYSLFAQALASSSNPNTVALVEALVARNPKSQYLGQVTSRYFGALQQTAPDRVAAAASKILEGNPENEEALLVAANVSMAARRNDEAIAHATRVTELLKSKPKPEGYTDADWEKLKSALSGRAYWVSGMGYAAENKFPQSDQSLRAALPHLKGDDGLMQTALFNLGLANYRMAQAGQKKLAADALHFSEQAAAIKGPLSAQAAKNAAVIRKEFALK